MSLVSGNLNCYSSIVGRVVLRRLRFCVESMQTNILIHLTLGYWLTNASVSSGGGNSQPTITAPPSIATKIYFRINLNCNEIPWQWHSHSCHISIAHITIQLREHTANKHNNWKQNLSAAGHKKINYFPSIPIYKSAWTH